MHFEGHSSKEASFCKVTNQCEAAKVSSGVEVSASIAGNAICVQRIAVFKAVFSASQSRPVIFHSLNEEAFLSKCSLNVLSLVTILPRKYIQCF